METSPDVKIHRDRFVVIDTLEVYVDLCTLGATGEINSFAWCESLQRRIFLSMRIYQKSRHLFIINEPSVAAASGGSGPD